jgi:RNA polymerase sigma factor (sigma-70 family)
MEAHAVLAPRVPARRAPVRHSLLSDERLAQLVGTGDERAFATLYERYHQPLYRYCRSMLRHEADAQDALQSAMASAYAALQRSRRDAPLRPWLFRIAHNESISVMRRRRPAAELTDDLGGSVASIEEHQERQAQLSLLLADLKELPERQRAALVMRELSGLSHEDIAVALDTSVGGAKQAIFEARRALSEFIEGRAMGCEDICRLVSDADGRVLRGRRVRAHLRDCQSCSAFAAMIPSRSADLRALTPPLPAIAAAGLLTRIVGASSSGGGSAGMGGGAGIAGSLTGKTVTLGLLTKAATTVAIVSAASFGITTAVEHATAAHGPSGATPVVNPAASGAEKADAVGAQTTPNLGAASASHRTNAASAASFGQHTSQTARSAVHGQSALAPRGLTASRPVKTRPAHPTPSHPAPSIPSHPTHPAAPTTGPSHSTGSSVGSTVSSTNSQQAGSTGTVHQAPQATTTSSTTTTNSAPLTLPVHLPHVGG